MMYCFIGQDAQTDFRFSARQTTFSQQQLTLISEQWLYVLQTDQTLDESGLIACEQLLQARPVLLDDLQGDLVITPRIGTISPWSSKATDILRNCDVPGVKRIERGRLFRFAEKHWADDLKQMDVHAYADPMMESVLQDAQQLMDLFTQQSPAPLSFIPVMAHGLDALQQANTELGLALSSDEMVYLFDHYQALGRDPSDAELMMFAQANSEHCRHKIFNATWTIDGEDKKDSLFGMIRHTYQQNSDHVLSAYADNASVMTGYEGQRWGVNVATGQYQASAEPMHVLMKVETHNHPTAISPFPGAATGSGGEIRDEGATGQGSKPKAGLTGFTVSNLRIPGYDRPWERTYGKPANMASAFDIMLEGPIGAASFNNEFGRPAINGYFRSYEQVLLGESAEQDEVRGYHKPIMLAGGLGNIRDAHVQKGDIPAGAKLVVLGGPAMQIGLGGGAASSVNSGESHEALDFASVQRGNPEMERRVQEVIDRCVAMGEQGRDNPILSIHDVGAGGLSNAFPELVADAGRGGKFQLRSIPNDEPGMSPLAIWCNESQERYVLAIDEERLPDFLALCERERCLVAVVGTATEKQHLVVKDKTFDNKPVDLPLDVLLGKPPKMHRDVISNNIKQPGFETEVLDLSDAIERVLTLPTVADKSFLVTIGDRSITGLIAQEQMVGPYQVPVADYGLTLNDYVGYAGEVMAMGERSPVALLDARASARLCVAEAITNLAAVPIESLSRIKLSANWMAACGHPGEDAKLFEAVEEVGKVLCPALDLTIPVGKDSLSMKAKWQQDGENKQVTSPLSLIITAFASVADVRGAVNPLLIDDEDTTLFLMDLSFGQTRMGGSALAQVYNQTGDVPANLDDADVLKRFFHWMQALLSQKWITAYHDRSDGGVITTLLEMAFAAKQGLTVDVSGLGSNPIATLFTEELGAVIQVKAEHCSAVQQLAAEYQLQDGLKPVAHLSGDDQITLVHQGRTLYQNTVHDLHQMWSQTSYQMAKHRDNPDCAKQAFEAIKQPSQRLDYAPSFDPDQSIVTPYLSQNIKPKVAILREQGVNGQQEMAAAFAQAGFDARDVHMSDLLSGRTDLADFKGIVACGGFSYGDVLGAGRGWAASVHYHPAVSDAFAAFFQRDDSFTLGVCNGCQMLSGLKHLIPGAEHWPDLKRNRSEQFEARTSLVEIVQTPSIFFQGMAGSRLPVAVAHGEGRAVFAPDDQAQALVAMRYINANGQVAEHYPQNPNGSPNGVTAFTTQDGRSTIMMPHPERVFRHIQQSWKPAGKSGDSPWMRLFQNARVWVD